MVPVLNQRFREQFEAIKNIVLTEVNVKEVEFLTDTTGIIKKKIKPDFKSFGAEIRKVDERDCRGNWQIWAKGNRRT
jgi:isoleucyl-tRNA synthetase